jgi:hypothetical protein
VDDDKINADDSLEEANDDFEKLLTKYTSTNPLTLYFDFKNLIDNGLIIIFLNRNNKVLSIYKIPQLTRQLKQPLSALNSRYRKD